MIDKDSIFILIRFINGAYSDWIEIKHTLLDAIQLDLRHPSEFISIMDRQYDYPYIVRVSEIQSIEVDVPTKVELEEFDNAK